MNILHLYDKKVDAIVIGAGLFGQVIAKALVAEGRHVAVLDNERPAGGSKPAACLMKPSWFSSMGKDVYDPSLDLLDELYGVEDISFTAGKVFNSTVHWIPPDKILSGVLPVVNTTVSSIDQDRRLVYLNLLGEHSMLDKPVTADLVVVAAGIWTQELLPQYKQVGQKGVAFLHTNARIEQPFILPWAPYRQIVAFNRGDGLWMSDGTAIKQENWSEKRELVSWARCNRAVPNDARGGTIQALVGVRPYAKGHKPCLLEEVTPGLWVASGGAKNGTMAAGHCARVIRERTS